MIPKDFPSSEDLARVKAEDDLYRIYTCDFADPKGLTDRGKFRLKEFFSNTEEKAKILDIALHLAPLAIDSTTDFLFGEPVQIEFDGDDKEENTKKLTALIERTGLMRKLKESSALFQSVGHTQFKLYPEVVEGKKAVCIEEIPYDYWFPNFSGVSLGEPSKDVRIVVYITNKDESGKVTKYVYVENYYLKTDTGKPLAFCAKALYLDNGGKVGDQVPLETLGIKADAGAKAEGLTMVEPTGLAELPVVELNARKTVKQRMGESSLKKALPILFEINDRLTQISIQFLKHLNAKLQIPDGSVVRDQKTGAIQRVDLEVLIAKQGEGDLARYITNDNPLIEQAFLHLESLIRKFAKLTQTPDSFLTEDDKGGVEKAEALKIRFMAFLKKVRNYQTTYDEGIRKMIRLAFLIEGESELAKLPLKITYDLGLPKDWQADVTVWASALTAGIASRETAVRMFQGLEGEELQAELDRIEEAEEALMQSQLDLMKQSDQEAEAA